MSDRDDFYVGYLALPRAHRRFLQVALPLLVFAMVFSAAGIALNQRDPGDGLWQTGEASTWSGEIWFDPYPVLHVQAGEDAGTYLLVRMGKRGAADLASPWIGKPPVSVRGRLLQRDGRRMIELDDAPGADAPIITWPVNAPIPSSPEITPLGPVTLRGEILDAKCYLGAMKPGDGRAHKACATLCIRGGIPPMLVSLDDSGARVYTLLADESGAPITDPILPFIGEPVVVSGRLEQRAVGRVLRLDPGAISRP